MTANSLRDPERSHPFSLLAETPAPDRDDASAQFTRAHNRAIRTWIGDPNATRRDERAILSLIDGIDGFVRAIGADADPYTWEHVLRPMFDAVGDALNLSLGRLDGAILSEWCHVTADRCGWDLDTHRPITHRVYRDDIWQHSATSANDAFIWLQNHTSYSHHHATTHEGWSIAEVAR